MNYDERYGIGYHGGDSPRYDPAVEAGKNGRYWHDKMIDDAGRSSNPVYLPSRESEVPAPTPRLSRSARSTACRACAETCEFASIQTMAAIQATRINTVRCWRK